MNETYLIITGIVAVISIIGIYNRWFDQFESFTKFITVILSTMAAIVMLMGSFFATLGDDTSHDYNAKTERIDDVIIVKSGDFPIQTTSDMKYIDKELYITRTQKHNAWGFPLLYTYEIKIRQ